MTEPVNQESAPPESLEQLLSTERRLKDRLTTAADPEGRAELKSEIIALFRAAEAAAVATQQLKERVKQLAEAWKQSERRPASGASRAMQTGHVDHLGASTYLEKGWSCLSTGDAPAAEVALRRALELVPGSAEAEGLLGWAQMSQGNFDTALLTFHNVLRREPNNALARANVGYVCRRKQIYAEAIEHLSSAIRLDNDPRATLYAHLYLGQVYFDREMYDDARLFFHKALALGPNLLQAYYELGRAHWFAGDRVAARTAWRDGAAANKFNPWGKRCAQQLTAVEGGAEPSRVE